MEQTVNQLIEELKKVFEKTGEVTDDIMSALHFMCGAPLVPAFDLVDRNAVTKLTAPSGRTLYQVIGSSGVPYTCFTSSNYCGCPAYKFSVLKRGENIMCKHVLAIRLSEAMGCVKHEDITDQHIASAIINMD